MSRKLTDEEKALNRLIHEKGRLAMQEALLGTKFDLVKNRLREVDSMIREASVSIGNAANGGFPRLSDAEMAMCRDGSFINAIKAIRERLNIGLKDAKEAVDHYREKNNLIRREC